MNAYELADTLNECIDDGSTDLYCVCHAAKMLRQQADRIAELEDRLSMYEIKDLDRPQIKDLSDEENNLKWWISSFEHLKALGGGINDEMEAKLKEMKEKLKKANEK
jgi:hypothetical protein